MSELHLKNLRNALSRRKWIVLGEGLGNDYDISAVWKVARPNGSQERHIEFDGLDDMKTLPIQNAFGCKVREAPEVSLYFARVNRSWPEELDSFMDSFDDIAT